MMAIQSVPFYWLTCDECGARIPEEHDDICSWSDITGAIAFAEYYDWLVTDDGHWCPECRVTDDAELRWEAHEDEEGE